MSEDAKDEATDLTIQLDKALRELRNVKRSSAFMSNEDNEGISGLQCTF